MKRAWPIAILLLLLIAGAMATKVLLVSVPSVGTSAQSGFDTARAFARLERILGEQQPHPVDSAANDAVRVRLVAELQGLGLRPTVTDQISCSEAGKERTVSCARVRNVVATVGPAAGGPHVLMVSHYDSTPVGPGAADDGIGVAAMLETAAVLRQRPLRRPVTFLFNEGEESGLLGARAFLDRNPLAARVDTLINLESRGVNGPAIMFETSRPNGRAISHFARAAERPAANSLTTDFYRLIPNRSDVTVFKERDWTILNFAVIGNETRYHSPADRLAALDPLSLGHMGAQALALAEDFAGRPPTEGRGSQLYADVLGRGLVWFPLWIGVAALWLMLAAFALLTWRRRDGLGRGAGTVLAALAAAALAVFLLQALVGVFRSGEWWRAHPQWIALGIDIAALAGAAAALMRLGGRVERLRLAYWLVFLALGALLSFVAPGAAIFFLLPPALAGAGLLVPRGRKLLALAAWAALFLSWAPLLHLSQVLLDFDAAWTFAPVSALLLLPVLIEMLPLLRRLPGKALSGMLAAAALLAWVPAALAPAYSQDRQQRFSIEYLWDAEAKEGRWLVYHDGRELPPGFAAFGPFERGVEIPWSSYKRWGAQAEGPAVEPPVLERIRERRTGEGRLVSFLLSSRGADVVRLLAPADAPIVAIRAGDVVRHFQGGDTKEDFLFRCHGRSCDGLRLDLLVGGSEPVEAKLIGTRSGLPDEARPLVEARPATAQPQYAPDSTIAVARVRF